MLFLLSESERKDIKGCNCRCNWKNNTFGIKYTFFIQYSTKKHPSLLF